MEGQDGALVCAESGVTLISAAPVQQCTHVCTAHAAAAQAADRLCDRLRVTSSAGGQPYDGRSWDFSFRGPVRRRADPCFARSLPRQTRRTLLPVSPNLTRLAAGARTIPLVLRRPCGGRARWRQGTGPAVWASREPFAAIGVIGGGDRGACSCPGTSVSCDRARRPLQRHSSRPAAAGLTTAAGRLPSRGSA